ncbi:acyl-CoA carboxylase subunit epsilon [Nocardioides sp. AE5]|uniref:acyl-CoA carboxylase subunit epsilon n=1 Tax=Nocardioides sp. AE5 TaxID=2962573 RepID=UPI002881BDA0|nr:acyl-CoA carboxylase subunit epsilon [Nocardioides sp. AE5]MDT0201910.1 acyl-CoA carboxylase subunit epsilon [Nocardioides sp. AE5]
MTENEDTTPAAQRPLLKVVNPDATPEEIAALVAVFSALGSGSGKPPRRPTSEWSAKHRRVRANYSHGPGGWRSSGLPQR